MTVQPGRRAARGMTLIELMITLAIAAIIMGIAYPSYMDTVRKGRRADAQAVLLEASQFMERFATENLRYDLTRAGVAVALPSTLAQAPKGTGTAYYTVTLQSVGQNSYTLGAVPNGSMVGDACGTMTLTETGVKGASLASCWRR